MCKFTCIGYSNVLRLFPLSLQEFSPASGNEPDHSIEEHSARAMHEFSPDADNDPNNEPDNKADHSIEERSARAVHEFSPAIDNDPDNEPDHSIEERSARAVHDEYETVAQMICTSEAIKIGQSGWIYAVRRECRIGIASCIPLCGIPLMIMSDPQTRHKRWRAIGAVYVYPSRPVSNPPSTVQRPFIGLKVKWYPFYHTRVTCGPNFCCCFAEL